MIEERIAYKQTADYAPERLRNNIELRMKRAGLSAAFSLLVPGPKMIWQFGELGYDYSINSNDEGELVPDEDHRTDVKPIRWDFYDDGVDGEGEDEYRRGLYNTYSDLLAFRKHNSTLYDMGAEFRWYVSVDHWPGRYMFLQKDGLNMALFGNFGEGSQDISVELPHDGTWYNAFTGAQWKGKHHTPNMAEGDFYLLVDKLSAVLDSSGSGDVESEGSEEEGGDEPGTGEGEGEQITSCRLTVRVHKNITWYDKYIYAWITDTEKLCGEWPGTKMLFDKEDGNYYVYYHEFSASMNGRSINYIINGDGAQTGDLSIELNGANTTVTVDSL